MKFIFVTGGTLSGLGKGTAISCIGAVLQGHGYKVTCVKIDPYLNVDAGTMSPYEHGEVYVLEDGAEVDLDLGNYERFLGLCLSKDHNITTGKIFQQIIAKEREGKFLGKTVQFVPHVTDAIKDWIKRVAQKEAESSKADVCLVEVGGTVGDMESAPFLEAIQQIYMEIEDPADFLLFHLTYIPELGVDKEQKTKPTQHSVRSLRSIGLQPNIIGCRCEHELQEHVADKVAKYAQVPKESVISMHTASNIYKVPGILQSQGIFDLISQHMKLPKRTPLAPEKNFSLAFWERLAERNDSGCVTIKIGIVGKYTGNQDAYLSVVKSLKHSSLQIGVGVELVWIESSDLESEDSQSWDLLKSVDGVVCPGGFGDRGIIGKANASKFCRQNKVPYLGICLGFQTTVIDMARNELGHSRANSSEFDPTTPHKVVIEMPEVDQMHLGGTMRLGNRATIIKDSSSLAFQLYDKNPVVFERHRHRFEINTDFKGALEEAGLKFVGQDDKGQRMEIAELKDHPYFLCAQYHPELTSRPGQPNPLFLGLMLCSAGFKKNGKEGCREFLDSRFQQFDGCLQSGKDNFFVPQF